MVDTQHHLPQQITYFHHLEVQTLEVHMEDLIPVRHLWVGYLLFGW